MKNNRQKQKTCSKLKPAPEIKPNLLDNITAQILDSGLGIKGQKEDIWGTIEKIKYELYIK